MGKKIVVVGGVAAGPKAAARARRRDPEAEITIVEKGELLSYAGCGLPFYVAGLIQEAEELMHNAAGAVRDAAFFKAVKDIKVMTRTLAEKIDRERKELLVVDLETGAKSRLPYDKLVVATGANPIVPKMDGTGLKRVFRVGHPDDAVAIRDAVESGEVDRVVVIGGGLIGLEMADALMNQGVDVTIVEMKDQLLAWLLDSDMAALLAKHLRSKGIDLRLGMPVRGLKGDADGNFVGAITDQGVIEGDMAVMAIGVRPNVTLAAEAGLKLGSTGAIAVNEYLQTSDPDIYAGGDCVENINLITGAPVYTPMGSTANKHGRVIGDNLTGGEEKFPGVLGTTILKSLGLNVGRTGLSEEAAKAAGYDPLTSVAPSPDCAHYYPANKIVVVKLIADAKTRRLLGAQALGMGDAVKRIDVAATAISLGATLDQFANLDLGYAPPYSTAIDVVAHAANVGRNKIDGLAHSIPSLDVKKKMDAGDDFILLDVRSPKEFETEHIADPRVRLVPLETLRERADELPRDKEIVTYCKVSLRGYEAAKILEALGFKKVRFMDGGVVAWPFETVTANGK
ncbi:MAG: FAD-dependent oxidoreductase [Chloroflexota bacterium]|jgi:NADPH-dependent 2,4-dienoyl-CoA reductase/sulfur reductase-like enzyme/rhodanese-related sulfurtransferase